MTSLSKLIPSETWINASDGLEKCSITCIPEYRLQFYESASEPTIENPAKLPDVTTVFEGTGDDIWVYNQFDIDVTIQVDG